MGLLQMSLTVFISVIFGGFAGSFCSENGLTAGILRFALHGVTDLDVKTSCQSTESLFVTAKYEWEDVQ